jgi:hypothetical protein
MDRRSFLAGTGAVLAASLTTEAQQQARTPSRIGWLTSSVIHANNVEAFREGMRALGYPAHCHLGPDPHRRPMWSPS